MSLATMKVALVGAVALSLGCAHALAKEDEHHDDGFGRFEFALIGDTPYRDTAKFENVLSAINADRKIRFVLHAGDMKTGSSPCSDELFADRLERFNRFAKPFVFTPGDNEWTDCHRVAVGQYPPLERLAKLRQMFFPVPGQTLGGKRMTVQSQAGDPAHAEFVENVRWTRNHVTFATLHVVGSQNGLDPFDPKSTVVRTPADDAEVARRIAAAVEWVRGTFAQAQANESRGVLFLFQANPNFEAAPGSPERKGFDEVLTALRDEAVAFGKPVVLAHGDSHYMRVDKPVRVSGTAIPNLTRVETFGDSDYHWLRIVADPDSAEVFSVHQEIVEANR